LAVSLGGCDRSTTKQSTGFVVPNDADAPDKPVEPPDSGTDVDADASPVVLVEDAGGANDPCPPDMAFLPAGDFKLGESGRKVKVSAFCIDKREVSVAAYAQCVRAKACSPRCIEENRCSAVPVDTEWGDEIEDKKASRRCNGGIPGREEHPVNCVSYDEAVAYCAAYGKRLPYEQEWEWAIRGGSKALRYPWGQLDAHAEELCWGKPHKDRPFKRASTCMGGSHPLDTTPQGVQDMAGNVSEWVIGTSGGRKYPTLRGASFWAVDDGYVKAAMWGFDSPAKRSEIFGVRCVRDAGASGKTPSSDVAR
jgi:formylglycine-generating enzyme required for sulfatase activity